MSFGDKHLTDGTEDPKERAPLLSLLFAYAAMLPMAAGAVGSVAAGSAGAARLTTAWAGAVLCFLSGVRRGLAFRQAGGSTAAQVSSMFSLFVLGAGSLLSPRRVPALVLLLLGYGSEAVLDPAAARRGEAPRYFARLRPAQLLIPVASLGLLLLCATAAFRAGRPAGSERPAAALAEAGRDAAVQAGMTPMVAVPLFGSGRADIAAAWPSASALNEE